MLVSIIIPTFNRAHLISETLDSVFAQTYTDWECLIIDDGSSDNTKEVVETYVAKDPRFKYYKRPKQHKSGGNGARNYGFIKSKGELINWFDSDDLMTKDFLKLKVETLISKKIDFVVSKTKYFNKDNHDFKYYEFNANDVTFESFAMGHINWSTPDTMVKRALVNTITYNENLKAGQEYNFICKLLLKTTSMATVDHFLTLRRAHEDSIRSRRIADEHYYLESKFNAHWLTYTDVKALTDHKDFSRYSLLKCITCYLQSRNAFKLPKGFGKSLKEVFKNRANAFYLAKATNQLFGKYNYFYKRLK
ncbi:glycosyltransferase family 2 protein [uncultured Winogradskyella sp.]|uniref:glycosyltransferase family 2 protein n=1 Tax=uncultured Winogradskyella sp. TaxID=395353 RepID=UPI0026048796|nr:glycosyltransferase family 2 protein [uncultured Winogradskyella sp.]